MTKASTNRFGTTFKTRFGWCGLLWEAGAVLRAAIAQPSRAAARRCLGEHQAAPPQAAPHGLAGLLARYFAGDDARFPRAIPLPPGTAFQRRVWAAAREIPRGEVATYGSLLRQPAAARAVGSALGRNPLPIIIPCHRVVAVNGRLGGYSAPGGAKLKARLLRLEGAPRAGKSS